MGLLDDANSCSAAMLTINAALQKTAVVEIHFLMAFLFVIINHMQSADYNYDLCFFLFVAHTRQNANK